MKEDLGGIQRENNFILGFYRFVWVDGGMFRGALILFNRKH